MPDFNISALRNLTGSTNFLDSRYKVPNYWLDTGCYAVNRILSGSTKNGIPGGRITTISGESQTCKSMMAARAIKSGQEQGIKYAFYLDTEGGALYEYMESAKIDGTKVEQILVPNVESAISYMAQIFETIQNHQKKDPESKFVIVFDSIGALRPEKLTTDGLKGNAPIDMGLAARRIGDMITMSTIPALKTDTAVILLNHTYENPGEMMPQKIKSQYGGNKVNYMSRYALQLSKTFRKSEKLFGESDLDTFYNGSEITAFCTKNATVRPFFEARMLNNFVDPNATKYYGLFEVAESYGLIIRENSMYKIPEYSGDKKWYAKDIINGKESTVIWDKLMPLIDAKSEIDMAFGVKDCSEYKSAIEADINSNSTAHMTIEQ